MRKSITLKRIFYLGFKSTYLFVIFLLFWQLNTVTDIVFLCLFIIFFPENSSWCRRSLLMRAALWRKWRQFYWWTKKKTVYFRPLTPRHVKQGWVFFLPKLLIGNLMKPCKLRVVSTTNQKTTSVWMFNFQVTWLVAGITAKIILIGRYIKLYNSIMNCQNVFGQCTVQRCPIATCGNWTNKLRLFVSTSILLVLKQAASSTVPLVTRCAHVIFFLLFVVVVVVYCKSLNYKHHNKSPYVSTKTK